MECRALLFHTYGLAGDDPFSITNEKAEIAISVLTPYAESGDVNSMFKLACIYSGNYGVIYYGEDYENLQIFPTPDDYRYLSTTKCNKYLTMFLKSKKYRNWEFGTYEAPFGQDKPIIDQMVRLIQYRFLNTDLVY